MSILSSKLKYEKKIKHLLGKAKMDVEEQKITLEYINEKKGDPLACMSILSSEYHALASKKLVLDKNLKEFKENIYIYSKLNILSRRERAFLVSGYSSNIFGLLVCNNQDLLNFIVRNLDLITYSKVKDELDNYRGFLYLTRTMLLALKGEFDEVLERCDRYLQNPLTHIEYKYKEYDFEFLKALANKDVDNMKRLINIMLEPKIARIMCYDMDVYFDFYLHLYVIIYAKIALYNGFDLEIDCEIAPKELIDNTPLKEYPEPYDFMKRFNFSTITPEEWKNWIYEYHPEPEHLKELEKEGYPV